MSLLAAQIINLENMHEANLEQFHTLRTGHLLHVVPSHYLICGNVFISHYIMYSPFLRPMCLSFLSQTHTHTTTTRSSFFQTIHFTSKVTPSGTKNEAAKC